MADAVAILDGLLGLNVERPSQRVLGLAFLVGALLEINPDILWSGIDNSCPSIAIDGGFQRSIAGKSR